MPQICDMGQTALIPPPEGRHAVDFCARNIRRIRPGSNPRSWVPEASMLTTKVAPIAKTLRRLFGTCFESVIDEKPTKPVSVCAV
jgi:hypothetical protein